MHDPERIRPTLVMLVVGVGTLLSAMAGSAVTLALPRIGQEFSVSIDSAGWVLEAYLLAVTSLLLVAGRVSDAVGHRTVYLIGFAWFGLASAGCGFANNLETLVAGRVLQGVGGAMMMATAPALLTTAFPPSRRGFALGTVSTATYVGLTVGPPLGGFLVAHASWRWVFFLNAPSAVLVVALGAALLPAAKRAPGERWDVAGTVTLLAGLPLALVAIDQGHSWGWLAWRTLAMAVAGLALLTLFVVLELRCPDPLLHLRLFRSRELTGATLSAVGNYVALFVPIILIPYYLTEGLGLTSSAAGFLLSVQPVLMAIVASPAGRLSDRIGTRGLAVTGMLALAAGMAGLSTVGASTSPAVVGLWLAVMGIGTGVFISPNSSALMGAAPRHQQGVAAGVLAVARNLGMMVGVALAMTVFHAAGGRTAQAWAETEFAALRLALMIASGIALLAALASAMRTPGRNATVTILALVVTAAALPACSTPAYVCTDREQCEDQQGNAGACEPTGYCSFADADCESGRRYASLSGAVSDQCVTGEAAAPITLLGSAFDTASDSATLDVDVSELPRAPAGETRYLLLAVAGQSFQPVTAVSGGGASWSRLEEQCAARRTTGISVWLGESDSSTSDSVAVTLSAAPATAIAVVSAFSAPSARIGLDVLGSANTAGVDGECSGTGTDTNAFSVPAVTSWSGSYVLLAIAPRHRSVFGESGAATLFSEQAEVGSAPAGITLVQFPHDALEDDSASGTLSGDEDWAAVALELY